MAELDSHTTSRWAPHIKFSFRRPVALTREHDWSSLPQYTHHIDLIFLKFTFEQLNWTQELYDLIYRLLWLEGKVQLQCARASDPSVEKICEHWPLFPKIEILRILKPLIDLTQNKNHSRTEWIVLCKSNVGRRSRYFALPMLEAPLIKHQDRARIPSDNLTWTLRRLWDSRSAGSTMDGPRGTSLVTINFDWDMHGSLGSLVFASWCRGNFLIHYMMRDQVSSAHWKTERVSSVHANKHNRFKTQV